MKTTIKAILSVWSDIVYVWWREMKTVFRDEGVLIFFILVPILYPLLYGFIYNPEVVREVPIVAVDESHSSAGREFVRRLDATPDVHVVAHAANMGEVRQYMQEHKAYGAVRIPSDFSSRLYRGERTVVGVYADMSGMLYYKGLLMAATGVSLGMNSHIKVERVPGATEAQSALLCNPIRYNEVNLYNPTAGYATFLVPAVLILILQQTLLLGIGMSVGTDRDRNRFHDLIPINRHFASSVCIVVGKAMCYMLIYIVMSFWLLCLVPKIFGYVQIGHVADLAAFVLPFLLASVFFAMTLSYFVRERETSMLLFVFTSVPFLFLSGISWPQFSIPEGWQWFSWLIPSTFGVNAYVRINSMGATIHQVAPLINALWIQALVYAVIAATLYKRQIYLCRRHIIEAWRRQKAHSLTIRRG